MYENLDYTTPVSGRRLRIRPGYVYIKISTEEMVKSKYDGKVHGALFHSLFEKQRKDFSPMPLTAGFARLNGEWRFNSGVLNEGLEEWQDKREKPSMSETEITLLKKAIAMWLKGAPQNITVKDLLESKVELIQQTKPAPRVVQSKKNGSFCSIF